MKPLRVFQAQNKSESSVWKQFLVLTEDVPEKQRGKITHELAVRFRETLGTAVSIKYLGVADYGVSGMILPWPATASGILNVMYAEAPGGRPIPPPPPPGPGPGPGPDPVTNGEKMNWIPIAAAGAALLLLGNRK